VLAVGCWDRTLSFWELSGVCVCVCVCVCVYVCVRVHIYVFHSIDEITHVYLFASVFLSHTHHAHIHTHVHAHTHTSQTGNQHGKDIMLDYDPCAICCYQEGQYVLVGMYEYTYVCVSVCVVRVCEC